MVSVEFTSLSKDKTVRLTYQFKLQKCTWQNRVNAAMNETMPNLMTSNEMCFT